MRGSPGCLKILCFAHTSVCVLKWCLLLHFLQCKPSLTLGESGVLAWLAKIDEKFRKACLPFFCRSGRGDAKLEDSPKEVDGWLPTQVEVSRGTRHVQFINVNGVQHDGARLTKEHWASRLRVLAGSARHFQCQVVITIPCKGVRNACDAHRSFSECSASVVLF